MSLGRVAELLPLVTLVLTAAGLWLAGCAAVRARLLGWALDGTGQLVLATFGVVAGHPGFLPYGVLALVLAANVARNWRRRGATGEPSRTGWDDHDAGGAGR